MDAEGPCGDNLHMGLYRTQTSSLRKSNWATRIEDQGGGVA